MKSYKRLAAVSAIAGLLIVATFEIATACNCTNWHLLKAAGSEQTSMDCPALEVTIAGQTFSFSAGTCPTTQTTYFQSLYDCNGGTLANINCNPIGNNVSYIIKTGGGCNVPTTLEEAENGLCKPPIGIQDSQPGAKLTNC